MESSAKIRPIARRLQAWFLVDSLRFPGLQTAILVLASGLIFAVGFKLSVSTFFGDNVSVCWPLVGIQAAALLRIPRRYWPSVIAGMVFSQLAVDGRPTIEQVVIETTSDVIEVVVAAVCLPPLTDLSDWLKQPYLLQRFIVWPMLLGPALVAFPVAAIFSHELHVGFWQYWASWFTADTLGIAIWLPLGVVLMSRETYNLFRWNALPRTLSLIGLLVAASSVLFLSRPAPVAFLILPILLVIALKLGFGGSVIAVNILGIISSRGTFHHLGPFGTILHPTNVITLQVFLASSMLICFPISIILLERDHFERERTAAYERMKQFAISDSLTGLANRRHFDAAFQEKWQQALRAGEPIALMMIDVDCFKLFNDLYGHLAGDECLRKIADTLRSTVKRTGDLAARFGGEEFVVLMPRTDLSGVHEVAEKVRSQIHQLNLEHHRNPHQFVTVSIGCWSMIPKHNILPEALIEAADQGLYFAKESGRNRIGHLQTTQPPGLISRAG